MRDGHAPCRDSQLIELRIRLKRTTKPRSETVSTNAKTGNGSRALGVLLDPKGPAIERIRRGEAYYGESFVKDTAYIAGYEPIRDASGEVIGIYATGYLKP